jgi:glycosyltransferase involved in cell wall biosynthesis
MNPYLFAFKAASRLERRLSRAAGGVSNWLVSSYVRSEHGSSSFESLVFDDDNERRWDLQRTAPGCDMTIVAVTYRQPAALKCFLDSLDCQTLRSFDVIVLHDGPDAESARVVADFAHQSPLRCRWIETPQRFNDYGHSLREIGIAQATGEYVLVTNGDNYYSPRTVEFALQAAGERDLDLVMWDMVHSHARPKPWYRRSYSAFSIFPMRNRADVGAFMVRTAIARAVGFRDKSHDGDATYLEDIMQSRPGLRIGKIEKTLLMHN